jgi:hypothetical protein
MYRMTRRSWAGMREMGPGNKVADVAGGGLHPHWELRRAAWSRNAARIEPDIVAQLGKVASGQVVLVAM